MPQAACIDEVLKPANLTRLTRLNVSVVFQASYAFSRFITLSIPLMCFEGLRVGIKPG